MRRKVPSAAGLTIAASPLRKLNAAGSLHGGRMADQHNVGAGRRPRGEPCPKQGVGEDDLLGSLRDVIEQITIDLRARPKATLPSDVFDRKG